MADESVRTFNLDEEGDPPAEILQCFACRNLLGYGDKPSCRAFPQGIPEEILSGEFDHGRPYEGVECILLPWSA